MFHILSISYTVKHQKWLIHIQLTATIAPDNLYSTKHGAVPNTKLTTSS